MTTKPIYQGRFCSAALLHQSLTYTGKELRPHWGLERTGIYGSLVTIFMGPCEVATTELVDWEDRIQNDFIRASNMLHWIVEFFGTPLEAGVLYQRLLMQWMGENLRQRGIPIIRKGDDLFVMDRKLSVSIATASPVSVLIHCGINIDPTGAPVAAIGLAELGFSMQDIFSFAKAVATQYIQEVDDIRNATTKVRPVI